MNQFTDENHRDIISTKKMIQNLLSVVTTTWPKDLANLIYSNCILTGGVSASIFHSQPVNDFDMYFKDVASLDRFNKMKTDSEISHLIKNADEKYMQYSLIGDKLITLNATTFTNKIQVITMHTAAAREQFDFVHCMPYYDISEQKYYISKNQYDIIKSKRLVKNPEHKLNLSDKRIEKFIKKGWRFV